MVTAAYVREQIEQYIERVSQRDIDAIVAMYADNAVVEDPVGSPPVEGIDAIDAFYRQGLGNSKATAGLVAPVRTTDVGEGAVAFQVKLEMHGRPCVINVIDVMRFDDEGKITSMKAYWSQSSVEMADG